MFAQTSGGDSANSATAYQKGVTTSTPSVDLEFSVLSPIRTNIDDKMNTIQGIIVDMENRDIYEGSMITKQAKVSVYADPEASYKVLIENQEVVKNPLSLFVTDGSTTRTITTHGIDSFVMDGVFDSVDSVCTDSPKVITIIYDQK